MSNQLEEVGRYLLQVLYDNYETGRYYSAETLADALKVEHAPLEDSLDSLHKKQLIIKNELGYRLSEKGYSVAYQRATSFCPHL